MSDGDRVLELVLRFDYPDERMASSILHSVEPDNKGYVESELDGSTVIYRIRADDAGSMRITADDLLVCIRIAEEASGIVVPVAGPDSDTLLE